ncbi:MAG: hypothetical protein ACOZE5_00220, partial [Verrucomicrobiota bacterium]
MRKKDPPFPAGSEVFACKLTSTWSLLPLSAVAARAAARHAAGISLHKGHDQQAQQAKKKDPGRAPGSRNDDRWRLLLGIGDGRLGGGETGDRHAVGRAG